MMGSTSIKDMIGKPMIDITFLTKNFLPDLNDEVFKELLDLGYDYMGPAPHSMNKEIDQFFLK